MYDSNKQLTLLALSHCLLGVFGVIYLVSLLRILFGMSENYANIISPAFLLIATIIYFACLFASGIFMRLRKYYRFSFVVTWIGLLLLSIPTFSLMTIFGIVTNFVLTKDSVKELYRSK